MKALFLEDTKVFKMKDIPMIKDQNKVTIKVKTMGICGSDISAYKGVLPLGTLPRVLGHEIAGEIVSVPENTKGLKVGDKVAVEPYQYCGECYPCSIGRTNSCENMRVIGVHENGGYMEYINHDLHLVHKVPSDMSLINAAMIEPLTISMQAVDRAIVKKGEYVVITGAGTIGLLAAVYVKYLGATPIVVDPAIKRLEIAKKLGIEYVFDPVKEDVVEEISKITNKKMAEVVVEASGAVPAVRSAIDYVSYTGRISLVGYPKTEVLLPTFLITKKELDIRGARNCVKKFPEAIQLIYEGKIKIEPIITNVIDFEEMPEYFQKISENPNDYLKVIAQMD
ncbi:alcohol dehydrogenase catalytic domain-containing protein [Crassaminicella profunda]|uniref:alcohol dehydrogenase catalytic domain-containing protein n=1 Tax=Crassaminicella profunda TaxID=1286698 RepID=UPI001CA694D0|nr:alcohol dehydrogenase catalytic domain-containing protein [Crassaminicella profunda]QZY54353.1 alcohol dehydrogenase catalytic domain-containing protein [Crassaminicella profunda]